MIAETEHPWAKARRLGKELSETLAEADGGGWYSIIKPAGTKFAVSFAAAPDPEATAESSWDRVNRLGWELAEALNDYGDGEFHAYVVPANRGGYCVMIGHRPERLPEPFADRFR